MRKNFLIRPPGFNKAPFIEVNTSEYKVLNGWDEICCKLNLRIKAIQKSKKIIVIETYQGIIHEEVNGSFQSGLKYNRFITTEKYLLPEEEIRKLVFPDVTNDRTFGYITRLTIEAFFNPLSVKKLQDEIASSEEGIIVLYGTGAFHLYPEPDLLVYADMARWEIQLRMRKHMVDNIGVKNRETPDWMLLYKQGFFVDWRVCDRLKKKMYDHWDFVLDTNTIGQPKLIEAKAVFDGLKIACQKPFSLVPYFDQGPWGGQWMKEKFRLDPGQSNYAWCFNCVPEENSLLLKFGDDLIETPAINLVFRHPHELLGNSVHARFGDEFPIRFDYLDTMDGGNLSLQVHPTTEYIQERFGMHYTQDESYYIMDAGDNAQVYLGLKEGIDPGNMINDLEEAQAGGSYFDTGKYIQTWPVRKHDHVLIPAGTVHCSGKNSVVLEISSTPYLFTFKLWDWGRLGTDNKPRPINIEHGENVINWDATTKWTKINLVNRIERIAEGEGWIEEHTGLHEREFIETRRHWFSKKVKHDTHGNVNVICLVEGEEIIVESPTNAFTPIVIHYGEVFIVPASVSEYIIRPFGRSEVTTCATLKAYVRS